MLFELGVNYGTQKKVTPERKRQTVHDKAVHFLLKFRQYSQELLNNGRI